MLSVFSPTLLNPQWNKPFTNSFSSLNETREKELKDQFPFPASLLHIRRQKPFLHPSLHKCITLSELEGHEESQRKFPPYPGRGGMPWSMGVTYLYHCKYWFSHRVKVLLVPISNLFEFSLRGSSLKSHSRAGNLFLLSNSLLCNLIM